MFVIKQNISVYPDIEPSESLQVVVDAVLIAVSQR